MERYKRLLNSLIFIVTTLIYPLTSEAAFQPSDIRLDTGDFAGASNSRGLQTCNTSDGYVYAVWEDYRNGIPNIYFNYSSDYGATWQATDTQIDLVPPVPPGIIAFDPQISCTEDGHVYVVYQYDDDEPFLEEVYIQLVRSNDHGQTWGGPSTVSNDFFMYHTDSLYPQISSTEDGHVYVAFLDNIGPGYPKEICYNYSSDFGTTWVDFLSVECLAGNFLNEGAEISSTEDGHVYLVWEDVGCDMGSGETCIFFNYSSDYGVNWQASDIKIDDNFGWDSSNSSMSNTEDGHVYITWRDDRDIGYDIYFNYSSDYGATWQPTDTRLDLGDAPGASGSGDPHISNTSNGYVYVVWTDSRDDLIGLDTYFQFSSDYGNTWQPSDIRVDLGDLPGQNRSIWPDISNNDNGNVYVSFTDNRNGGMDILLNVSLNYGASWLASPLRVNTGSPLGSGDAGSSNVNSDPSGNIYVTWIDGRNGQDDIYFNYSDASNGYPPTPNLHFYGDADGDTLITGIDVNQANAYILSKPYTVDTLQPANPMDDWNTMDVDSDRILDGQDVNQMNAFILSKPVTINSLPWILENDDGAVWGIPPGGNPSGVAIPFQINLKSTHPTEGLSGRAGLSVIAEINPASPGSGSLSGRDCNPNPGPIGPRDQANLADDQCAIAVTITDWNDLAPDLGLTESGGYGFTITGNGDGDLILDFRIEANPAFGIPAVTLTLNVSF